MGSLPSIDSIKIEWPDDRVEVIKNVKSNQLLLLDHANATIATQQYSISEAHTLFNAVSDQDGFNFKHTEAQNFDFGYHQPLPQKYSQLGPCIATGDINRDGLIDFFVGGATNQSGEIFMQHSDGHFVSTKLVAGNKAEEDLGAELFDADGDQDLDLLITGGSFEFSVAKYNQPRLYINDGKGKFQLDATALPLNTDITDVVSTADYDGDGDLDIFIGGRLQTKNYPQSPRSYISK